MVNALAREKAHYGRKIRKELHRLERDMSWSGAGGIEPRRLNWKSRALPLS